ncbi:MAG: 50S ribosomal protein L22 [Elusimicrobia bacterium]|nr:50S ribosomal protein L22 [Elusimicrobiota bacterium]
MTEARSVARYIRASPRKLGQVLGAIRRKNAQRALDTLEFLPKRAAVVAAKALKSALSNLDGKLGRKLQPREAWVKTALANGGPVMKRIHTGSMGRAMPYKHRTCHLTIVVSDQP